MKPVRPNIAILELGGGHQECIESQVMFLRHAGYTVHLIVPEKFLPLMSQESLSCHVYPHSAHGSKSLLKLGRIAGYIRKNQIHRIVMNTAENAIVRNFLWMVPGVKCYGILHNISKLSHSRTQRSISRRIPIYFILNDILRRNLGPGDLKKVRSFYPIFFPESIPERKIKKPAGEFWITIPGQLEFKRRDYDRLILSVSSDLPANVRFILLGNSSRGDGPAISAKVQKMGLESKFVFFNGYVSEPEYHDYIMNSDMIMPLIHPGENEGEEYLRNNISGSFNLAFAYKKPMLAHEIFRDIDDFREGSVFYNYENLREKIISIIGNSRTLQDLVRNLENYSKFSFEFQYNCYLNVIENKYK